MEDPSPTLAITELGLRARTRNALLSAGISEVSEVLALLESGDEALADAAGLSANGLAEVKEGLTQQGFRLPGEEAVSASAPAEIAASEATTEPEPATASEPSAMATGDVESEDAPSEPIGEVGSDTAHEAASAGPTLGDRLRATLAAGGARAAMIAGGVLAIALILVALLLPPLSLLQRMGLVGWEVLDASHPEVSVPNEIMLEVNPETFPDRLKVRLESVPQLNFLEGSAGGKLRDAVEALPSYLQAKSQYYKLQVRGEATEPVTVKIPIPTGAEPWETLDLYTWDGQTWQWAGGELHAEMADHETLQLHTTELPESLLVVQSSPITPTRGAYIKADDGPTTAAAAVLDEIHPVGLLLGTMGGFAGNINHSPRPNDGLVDYDVMPVVRNWAPGASVNTGLLQDVLTLEETRAAHIANLTQLCTDNGFAGVEIDYRGLSVENQAAYTDFISELAKSLHERGLRLYVVLPNPMDENGTIDSTGYDWRRIGQVADAVKVPFPANPAAYGTGGEVSRLLNWATAQVSRYKLRMVVSSLSARQASEIEYISLAEALAPFGDVTALTDVEYVKPGTQLEFGLSGEILSITPHESAGTYQLEYRNDQKTQTVWLGTPACLSAKAQWAANYHLGGIAIDDMFDHGNAEGIIDVVAAYSTMGAPQVAQNIDVRWATENEATTVDQQVAPLNTPGYTWMAIVDTGTYTVNASIAGFDHGSVLVTVGEPAPAVTTTVAAITETETTTPTEAADVDEGDVVTTCLDAAYVQDVTVPDNTQFENGEEFDKTWRVRNTGECAWPEDTVIAFAQNAQMGAPDSVEVGVVEPGTEADITVKMVAPEEPGKYTGVWQLKSADEGFFGGQLTVVIQAGETSGPVTVVGPVAPGAFELGGHIRDHGIPYADKMHYAGMTWTKVQVHFGQDASGIINVSHAKGFKVQLSALGPADMVTQPGFEQEYANWVASMAAQGADAIEVWNEPNIDREWKVGHISPQAYTNLLCTSYQAIKAANAGTAVISAAPSPTGYFGGCSPNGCDDAPWMAGLRDAGAANCMDYIGAHHNAGATSPSARSGHPAGTHHSWYFLPQTELYYNTFGGARQIFYTEMGYASQEGVPPFHDAFAWARGNTNAEQAQWLAEAVSISVNTGMVRCIIVWNIDYVRYGYDPQAGFAIIRPGGSCPACETLHNVLGTR